MTVVIAGEQVYDSVKSCQGVCLIVTMIDLHLDFDKMTHLRDQLSQVSKPFALFRTLSVKVFFLFIRRARLPSKCFSFCASSNFGP